MIDFTKYIDLFRILTSYQEVKVKKLKKIKIFSKIYHFDLPPRGQKFEKSKNSIYLVKSIILASHQEFKKTKSRKK